MYPPHANFAAKGMALAPVAVHGGGMGAILSRSARRHLIRGGGIVLAVLALLIVIATLAGFFAADPVRVFPAQGVPRPVGVLYISGDMGLRFGPNPDTTAAMAGQGITVVGLNAPTAFRRWRLRAAVDAIVAEGVRRALAVSGARRLVLVGQSYGADVLHTGLAHLPAALRAHVAGVVLVVPGETVFFRADPSGFAYRGTPDGRAATTLAALNWTQLTCIHGREETDSACPGLHHPQARVITQPRPRIITMPGGHFLRDDHAALAAHVIAAIRRAVPEAFR